MGYSDIASLAIEEMRQRSKLRLYQTDFTAWKADVLGLHTYAKMQEITETALFGDIPRTMIKSANGTAKSYEQALMIAWVGSVFPPGDAISIVSAPSVAQLEKVIWAYLKNNYSRAFERDVKLPGRIDEQLGWVIDGPAGKVWLATGRKPPEHDAVSTFQGLRSRTGKTFVFFDEAGGMSKPMFTAAEAVMTGSDARFIGIGNPDHTGTEFHHIFMDKTLAAEYNLFTISAFDLPTLTGERVYPLTPEGDKMEAQMLASLTSRKWVEHKQRVWGEKDARYLSKVMGEFAGDGDNAFFPQRIITLAQEKEIVDDASIRPILGCDIARYGQDESVIYENRGGRLRLLDSWGKVDTVESARRIHRHAMDIGAEQVRIDAGGIGGAVFDMLDSLEEFTGAKYVLIGIDGGTRSPDPAQWLNNRAYNHAYLRDRMAEGEIDIDFEDRDLADQMLGVTYKFTPRGSIQIAPKDEMRTVMDGSPDRLDAAIYATVDMEWLLDPNRINPGDRVNWAPEEFLQEQTSGMPYLY